MTKPTSPDGAAIDEALFSAARRGDAVTLSGLLAGHPDRLHARTDPYRLTLLHLAADHLAVVDLLLGLGFDPDVRDEGDNSCPIHWAAAAGNEAVVRRLVEAGADVVGAGDDHELDVIGWATCWNDGSDPRGRAIADFLVARGARHHIFSAIALNLGDEVRRIVAASPTALTRRQSRNENHRTPLHFAVAKRRPAMVALLLELGADPLATDGWGMPVAAEATAPDVDRPVMEAVRAMTRREIQSAKSGARPARTTPLDLLAVLSLQRWDDAEELATGNPGLIAPEGGLLHLVAKRGAPEGVRWLLDHGADPNGIWAHWDSLVTPLHLAILADHPDVAGLLLAAGASPAIRDSRHDADARAWATFFERAAISRLLESRAASGDG